MLRFLLDALIILGLPGVAPLVVGYASLNSLFFKPAAPGPVETSLAQRARSLAIPADARRARNPFAG